MRSVIRGGRTIRRATQGVLLRWRWKRCARCKTRRANTTGAVYKTELRIPGAVIEIWTRHP